MIEIESRIAPPPAATAHHLPELDGVRGIAIIAVLLAHSVSFLNVWPQGIPGVYWPGVLRMLFLPAYGGVDLFFTLSGFLITGILLRARTKPAYFKSFYMRRVLRIFPIYYLVLAVTVLLDRTSLLQHGLIPVGISNRLPYFFYLQNWPVFWVDWTGMASLWGAYWSLAVEEQFYMLWPTVVRFLNLRALFALCAVGYLLGWPARAFLFHKFGIELGIMQSPFCRLDGLFLGAAIAIYREAYSRPVPLSWAKAAFSAGACIFASIVIFHLTELPSGKGLHIWRDGVSAFGLMSAGLIIATQHRVPAIHRLLTVWPLRLAGRLSYGMYVYHLLIFETLMQVFRFHPEHNPLRAFMDVALSLIVVVAVSELSFRFIETPFLRLKRLFPSPGAPVSQAAS